MAEQPGLNYYRESIQMNCILVAKPVAFSIE